jgi:hypothetical protein
VRAGVRGEGGGVRGKGARVGGRAPSYLWGSDPSASPLRASQSAPSAAFRKSRRRRAQRRRTAFSREACIVAPHTAAHIGKPQHQPKTAEASSRSRFLSAHSNTVGKSQARSVRRRANPLQGANAAAGRCKCKANVRPAANKYSRRPFTLMARRNKEHK